MFIINTSIKKKLNIVLKRFFLFLSIYLSSFYFIYSQEIRFSDPYSEKILFNPSYSGLNQCAEINLTYNKNYVYDHYSASYNQFIEKYNSSIGIIFSNISQAKGAITNLKTDLIYSYKIKLGKNKILNSAIQASYFQQNVNYSSLIFNNQINPLNGIIEPSSGESVFPAYKSSDFSVGSSYISDKYRLGFVVHHVDKIFNNKSQISLNPIYRIHFGKVFSVKNKAVKNYLNSFTPEVIYNSQSGFHQIIYGVHLINNIFLTRVFIKHNLQFNSISTIFTIGLNYKNIRLSYTYDLLLTKIFSLPTGGNQLSIRYNFNCRKKRIVNNTIFCSNI